MAWVYAIWESEAYTLDELAVLTVLLLKADSQGYSGYSQSYLARKAAMGPKRVRRVCTALVRIGVLVQVEPPQGQGGAVYRLMLARLAEQAAAAAGQGSATHVDPGRFERHRLPIAGLDETLYLVDTLDHRLVDLEALIAADLQRPAAKRMPAERLTQLMSERDNLELDLIPKLKSHSRLYGRGASGPPDPAGP